MKPSEYHTYGSVSHADIAKKLQISTSLSAKIESDVFLKFSLALFNPPWSIRELSLRRLKDARGQQLHFDVGECSELLEERVRDVISSEDDFRREYEKKIVEISKSVMFRRFVLQILTGEE